MYNWQAALQLASAYYNTSVSYPSGTPSTTDYLQGICPKGWHLPSGGTTATASEFFKLDTAVGGTGANGQNGTNYTAFWKPTATTTVTTTDPFKGLYLGHVTHNGSVYLQGSVGYWWSASEGAATNAYFLGIRTSDVYPQNSTNKGYGFSVRCVKD
jgi:uncharacterized protein (TIGR02145 family)